MSKNKNRNKYSIKPFDQQEYSQIFEELYEPLCRFGLRLLGNTEQVEDIVQEQFVYLWENWDRLSGIDSIDAYLYKAVKNKSINFLQKQAKNAIHNVDDEKNSLKDHTSKDPQQILEGKNLEKILEKAIESLPGQCRIIFSLKRFGDLSNAEIADKLSISVKTVEAQTTIALRRLRAYLGKHWLLLLVLIGASFLNIL